MNTVKSNENRWTCERRTVVILFLIISFVMIIILTDEFKVVSKNRYGQLPTNFNYNIRALIIGLGLSNIFTAIISIFGFVISVFGDFDMDIVLLKFLKTLIFFVLSLSLTVGLFIVIYYINFVNDIDEPLRNSCLIETLLFFIKIGIIFGLLCRDCYRCCLNKFVDEPIIESHTKPLLQDCDL